MVHLIGVYKIPYVFWVQGENYCNRNVNPYSTHTLSGHFYFTRAVWFLSRDGVIDCSLAVEDL